MGIELEEMFFLPIFRCLFFFFLIKCSLDYCKPLVNVENDLKLTMSDYFASVLIAFIEDWPYGVLAIFLD